MTIDLMSLAKQAEDTYIDVVCSFGNIRVYHVPDVVLLSGSSVFSEPDLPTVLMKTATGTQERPAKRGDAVFEEWQAEIAAIREAQFDLRQAKGFVLALQDIDWSQYDTTKPPPNKLAQDIYNGHWPDDDMLRKKAWLDFTVLRIRDDREKILEAMNQMNQANEATAEGVEAVKKNSE